MAAACICRSQRAERKPRQKTHMATGGMALVLRLVLCAYLLYCRSYQCPRKPIKTSMFHTYHESQPTVHFLSNCVTASQPTSIGNVLLCDCIAWTSLPECFFRPNKTKIITCCLPNKKNDGQMMGNMLLFPLCGAFQYV